MKALCKSLIALSALALVSTSAALAVPTLGTPSQVIRLSGSTAYRAASLNAVASILGSPTAIFAASGGQIGGANDVAFEGFYPKTSSTVVEVRCHFNGSLTGILGLTVPATNKYNFVQWDSTATAVTPGGQANFFSPFGLKPSAGGGTRIASVTTDFAADNHTTDAGFSDTDQATAAIVPGTSAVINATSLNDWGPLGIIPFVWIKSSAQTTDADFATWGRLTDVTNIAAQQWLAQGTVPAQLFTNNTADAGVNVICVGRDQDSGTRVSEYSETAFGVDGSPVQYFASSCGGPTSAPTLSSTSPGPHVNPDFAVQNVSAYSVQTYPNVGGGYASGGQIASAFELTGWDNHSLATFGYPITYMGIADADGALAAALVVTSPVASGVSSFVASSATATSSSEVIAVGQVVSFYTLNTNTVIGTTTVAGSYVSGSTTVPLTANSPAGGPFTVTIDTKPATYVRPAFLSANGVPYNQANINNGKYQMWEDEHFFTVGASLTAFESDLVSQLNGTTGNDCQIAGYPESSQTTAGGLTTAKNGPGQPIHY